MNKAKAIVCPKCGCEYLPCEIFYPDMIGDAKPIIKDDKGKIIWFDGNDINPKETYVCDKCGCEFEVTMNITYDIKKSEFDKGE